MDRIPAYIPYATAPAGKMGATYDGVHWAPPEPYQWRHAAPPAPAAPRIYEAHVGMSSPEPKVNSYRAFADDVLPRIKAGGYNTVQLMAVQARPARCVRPRRRHPAPRQHHPPLPPAAAARRRSTRTTRRSATT